VGVQKNRTKYTHRSHISCLSLLSNFAERVFVARSAIKLALFGYYIVSRHDCLAVNTGPAGRMHEFAIHLGSRSFFEKREKG